MSGWGIQMRSFGLDVESKCWRCQREPFPTRTSSVSAKRAARPFRT